MIPYTVRPILLKHSMVFQHQLADQFLHPLYHDHELIAAAVHMPYIRLAEIPPVQDEPDILISITGCLVDHDLQLCHIIDAPRILFIKERFIIVLVQRDRIIHDRLVLLILFMADFRQGNISGLAVFIC